MKPAAPSDSPSGALDFVRHRVQRALRQRLRYRYVRPRVLREAQGLRIESPCCSRNVDARGGVIDIALLEPLPTPDAPGPQRWALYARDHRAGAWVLHLQSSDLNELLKQLCTDPQRVLWP